MNAGKLISSLHTKCRNSIYPRSSVLRFAVPDEKVSWDVEWPEYKPVSFTSPKITNQPWADPDIKDEFFKPSWNALDGTVNRKSHGSPYKVVDGFPLNPTGRTGMRGRGVLGRWGPNHAADPIITRWKKNSERAVERNEDTGKPILQFVGIERKDCQEWAIPGGMVDPGETVNSALRREFMEEALNFLSEKEENKKEKEEIVGKIFSNGVEIYKGYVDDPRNTDNAWMETIACNFHDEDGEYLEDIHLEAGDDAAKVKWIDVNSNLNLYASHFVFILKVAQLRNSHW